MRTLLLTACLALGLCSTPSWAAVYTGVVRNTSLHTVWIQNGPNVYAVPVERATFVIGGTVVPLGNLEPGTPVSIYTPYFVGGVASGPVHGAPVFGAPPVYYAPPGTFKHYRGDPYWRDGHWEYDEERVR